LARHAGFGTVATITGAAVNEAIASYLGGNLGPIKFPLPGPFTIGATTVTLGGFLQMLPPTVELHPNPADLVRVQFGFKGAVSAQIGSQPSQGFSVELDGKVDCGLLSTVENGQVTLGLDTSRLAFQPLKESGSPLPASVKTAVESQAFADAITNFVKSLSPIPASPPMLSAEIKLTQPSPAGDPSLSEFNWFTVEAAATRIVVKPLEGVVTVGVDFAVFAPDTERAIYQTQGDEAQLIDLTATRGPGSIYVFTIYDDTDPKETPILVRNLVPSGGAIASTTNLALLAAVVGEISQQIRGSMVSANIRINSISLGYTEFDKELRGREDALALNFDLTMFPGAVGVTGRFLLQPYLTTFANPMHRWQVDAWKLFVTKLDVDPDWWQEAAVFTLTLFFGALVPVVGPLLALAEVAMIGDVVPTLLSNIENRVLKGLQDGKNQIGFPKPWNKPLPGLSTPNWQGWIRYVSAYSDGVDIAIETIPSDPGSFVAPSDTPSDPSVGLSVRSGELIQGTWGERGNFELVVPQEDRLVHYARLNDLPGFPWIHVDDIPLPMLVLKDGHGRAHPSKRPAITPVGVSLIQSTFNAPGNPGNFELAVRMRNALSPGDDQNDWLDFYTLDSIGRAWHGPYRLALSGAQPIDGVSGDPSLIQSTGGLRPGNFELVVPQGDRLVHYTRLNDRPAFPWLYVADLPLPTPVMGKKRAELGAIALGASLIQSNFNTPLYPGNLELVVRHRPTAATDSASDWLGFYTFDTVGRKWHGPSEIFVDGSHITGITGDPALIQSTWGGQYGNFELVVPQGERLVHYARLNDQPGYPWIHIADLPMPSVILQSGRGHSSSSGQGAAIALDASLIQSNFNTPDNPGNFELAVRMRSALSPDETENDWLAFYTLDSISRNWHGPNEVRANGQQVSGITGF